MRVGRGLTRSWSCGDEHWRQKVLVLVGLKRNMKYDFSATTQEEGMLDSMVRWYPRKTYFTTWDRCSKRMGISMKMLVIELKPAG
jgi:hypothetical protein